jgi:hypothetical protein
MHYYNNDTTTTNLNIKKEQPKDGPPSSFTTRQSLLINLGFFGAGLAVSYLPKLGEKKSESEMDANANKSELDDRNYIRRLENDFAGITERNEQLSSELRASQQLETRALDQLHKCRSELQTEREANKDALSQVKALKSELDEFNQQLLEMRSFNDK